jgi:hypothetical protein
MEREKLERVQKIINGFYEEWGEMKPMSIEHIDTITPLMNAYKLIDDTLREDTNYEHLTKETRILLNTALVDLSQLMIRNMSMPSYLVTDK